MNFMCGDFKGINAKCRHVNIKHIEIIEDKIKDVKFKIAHYKEKSKHINETHRRKQLEFYRKELNNLQIKNK